MFSSKMNIFVVLGFLTLILSSPIVTTVSQNSAASDGGDDFDTATPIVSGSYQGYLESPDLNDYYKIYVNVGYKINVTMTPPTEADFDLFLYDPNRELIGSSTEDVGPENIIYIALDSGDYFIRISVFSGSGSYSLEVSLEDVNPPTLSINSPTSGSYVGIMTNITGESNDPASGVQKVEVKIDDGSWQLATGTTSWSYLWNTTGFVPDSYHTITVRVTDNNNNTRMKSVEVTVDNVAPKISIISPENNSELKSSNVDITWVGSDTCSGLDHYEIKLDDSSWIIKGVASHNFTEVSDGSHKVQVKAIDKAGNSKEASVSFTVNTSFIFGPGWIDDIVVLGGIAAIAVIVIYLIIRKWMPYLLI
ncbi:MAG: Ig-like domain-containing protein [Candidatus Methylarchaceae archaeon HK02M2]|nr:Ig-like domain-containing protein [Candidatus Methylarchaceae archaeon HK02M2]